MTIFFHVTAQRNRQANYRNDEQIGSSTHNTEWLVSDRQNTVRLIFDAPSTVDDMNLYSGYGFKTPSNSGEDILFGYTGRYTDTDTNLNWNGARWYSPSLGRFISTDPSEFDGGSSNLYEYAMNDPTNLSDPSGLNPQGFGSLTPATISVPPEILADFQNSTPTYTVQSAIGAAPFSEAEIRNSFGQEAGRRYREQVDDIESRLDQCAAISPRKSSQ